ncbi:glycosyltransferase, partial [Chitinophaga sp.]|uniref:glycosyltransferase n=1 Tax=Chitinophaga sp. TaxID=1869181 RepID=UPI002F92011B
YLAFPYPVQRADIFRVMIVYLLGGFYLDLDMLCLKELDDLRDGELVLGIEKVLSEEEADHLGHRYRTRIANYMFGARAGHAFLHDFLEAASVKSTGTIAHEQDILEMTGPGLLTKVYHRMKHRYNDIVLLENSSRPCPKSCGPASCHFGDYAVHYHVGSWRWESVLNSVLLLETYPSAETPYDGLSGVFSRIKEIGTVVPDTSSMEGEKVLVCGIAPLYENRISSRNSNAIFTTFESDQLPENWVAAINQYRHCIVPHEAIREVFRNSGVSVPVTVIHQGYHRFRRTQMSYTTPEIFNVGFLGVPVKRKNLLKLYEACRQLQEECIPQLKLHVHVSSSYDWLDMQAFQAMKNDEMVVWSTGKLNDEQMAAWYHQLSCYIFPSSGEGWSYTPRESMYLGIPTIVTDIPVHRELAKSGYCRVIPAAAKEPADFEGICIGDWARIEVDAIKDAIRDVHNRYTHFRNLSAKGSEWIKNKWKNEDMLLSLQGFVSSF